MKHSKMATWLIIFIVCLALVPAPSCGGGTDYSQTIGQITAFIEQEMSDNQVTGLSIALVDGQDVVWAQGFGYADKENGIEATPETIYEIGSISKTMAGTAIMQLAEEGLVDIDQPLTKYLPEFSLGPPLLPGPTPAGPITIRTMLTHHSGIPCSQRDVLIGAWTRKPDPGYNDWLLNYLHDEYAAYPPNFVLAYDNYALTLLGEIVARVSGQSFEGYTHGLFEKMGMQSSSFFLGDFLDDPSLSPRLARGYLEERPIDQFYINVGGAGSALSSVSDMASYIKMLHAGGRYEGGVVLRPETLAEMLTRQNEGVPLDLGWRQGLVWMLGDPELDYAGRLCWHNGATLVFRAHLEALVDHQLGVVVLSNSCTAGDVVRDVARKALKLALKEKEGIEPVEPSGPTYSPYTNWPQERLEALAGVYVTTDGYDLIEAVPGGLEWIHDAGPAQKLVPLENGWFAPPDSQEFQIEFNTISGRDVMVWHGIWEFGDRRLLGERYKPVPVPTAWHDRLGKYEVTNLPPEDCSWFVPEPLRTVTFSIELKERDGMLIIELFDGIGAGIQLAIEPLTDTLGLIRGLGPGKSQALPIVTFDGEERIQLWGCLYKRS